MTKNRIHVTPLLAAVLSVLVLVSPSTPGGYAGQGRKMQPAESGNLEKARALWLGRQTRSAIQMLERIAADKQSAGQAGAQLLLGDIYFSNGWESEGAFPGWHDQPEFRPRAEAAYRSAAALKPEWPAPHAGLGRILLQQGKSQEALIEFDAALQLSPNDATAHFGRARALAALGRTADAETAMALGRAARPAPWALADQVAAARTGKKSAEVMELASRFLSQFPSDDRIVDVYDALLEAYQATPSTPPGLFADAVEARSKYRNDPGPILAAANLLVAKNTDLDRAIRLAGKSVDAAQQWIDQNLDAYKLAEKAENSLRRSRAGAADTAGWAYFAKKELRQAEAKLFEAEQLFRGQDAANQYHIAEFQLSQQQWEIAREHYLACLSLTSPPPLQAAAKKSLAEVYARLGNDSSRLDKYLDAELTRRMEIRRNETLASLLDQRAPSLKLNDVNGRPFELASLRGKAVLLNFFTSW
jgi:tetratricopeptide (TPR) repeat protein